MFKKKDSPLKYSIVFLILTIALVNVLRVSSQSDIAEIIIKPETPKYNDNFTIEVILPSKMNITIQILKGDKLFWEKKYVNIKQISINANEDLKNEFPLPPGEYTVKLIELNKVKTFTIEKLKTEIARVDTLKELKIGEEGKIKIKLEDEKGKEIPNAKISINGEIEKLGITKTSLVTDQKGIAEIELMPKERGNFSLSIIYEGSEEYEGSEKVLTIKVKGIETKTICSLLIDKKKYFVNEDIIISCKITNLKGETLTNLAGSLKLEADGFTYRPKIVNGEVIIVKKVKEFIKLPEKRVILTFSYPGDCEYEPSQASIKLDIKTAMTYLYITKFEKTDKKYTLDVRLVDVLGYGVSGKKIILKKDNSEVIAIEKTNENGIATFELDNLGKYMISFDGDAYFAPSSLSIDLKSEESFLTKPVLIITIIVIIIILAGIGFLFAFRGRVNVEEYERKIRQYKSELTKLQQENNYLKNQYSQLNQSIDSIRWSLREVSDHFKNLSKEAPEYREVFDILSSLISNVESPARYDYLSKLKESLKRQIPIDVKTLRNEAIRKYNALIKELEKIHANLDTKILEQMLEIIFGLIKRGDSSFDNNEKRMYYLLASQLLDDVKKLKDDPDIGIRLLKLRLIGFFDRFSLKTISDENV